MTAPISGNRPVVAPKQSATSSSDGMSASEAKSYVQQLTSKDVESRKTFLGDSRTNHMKDEITKEMDAFLAANPNATKEEIDAKYKDVSGKKYGYEFSNKMRDDYFIGQLKKRMKEALADRWE